MRNGARKIAAFTLSWALTSLAVAQELPDIGFESVGRAWPLLESVGGGTGFGRRGGGPGGFGGGPGRGGRGSEPSNAPPEGVEPLERDLFTSDDFYADKELWSDPRYFRCLTSTEMESVWGSGGPGGASGDVNDPSTARWGDCDRDYPREAIVSPYPFATAQEHYEALLDETRERGGPTEHSYATVPGEWTGVYSHPVFTPNNRSWYGMGYNQVPTILSLLTDEYQTYKVQETYHHGHTNAAQWPSQYCWPEGFMRRWHNAAVWERYIMVTPDVVQILGGVARNFITTIHIGREFNMDGAVPYLSEQVPRWYGETIGFWDNDTLITWTSNIQGWTAHGAFEHSNFMQSIEIYTPVKDEEGNLVSISHESILYDEEALVEPVRIVGSMAKAGSFAEETPYVFIECVQTIFPIDGVGTPVTPGQTIEYQVPDMYDRPWGHIWEENFEQHMEKPEEEDIFSFD